MSLQPCLTPCPMGRPEEPQLGSPCDRHSISTSEMGPHVFSTGDADSVRIKGMETEGGNLIMLERTREDVTEAIRPWLRRIDLSTCLKSDVCTSGQREIDLAHRTDADFNGLVSLERGQFLIVSDDKIDGDLRSVFVLLQIPEQRRSSARFCGCLSAGMD